MNVEFLIINMKNILFYLNSEKKFDKIHSLMAEVQIENSLNYWKPEDIIVVTNFSWEYNGIKAIVAPEDVYCNVITNGFPGSNKPNVIIYLIENNLIDNVNWIHDWDAFQLAPLNLSSLNKSIGFIDYGYKSRIQYGNVFFKPSALDVFQWIKNYIYKNNKDEEETTNLLIKENFNNINDRFERLNTTYNIGMRNVRTLVSMADKPLRIAHFPPHNPKYLNKFKPLLPEKLYKMLYERFAYLH